MPGRFERLPETVRKRKAVPWLNLHREGQAAQRFDRLAFVVAND